MDWTGYWNGGGQDQFGVDGGDYNKQWKVTKHRFKGKLQEWTDCVDKCSIILYGFELTKANRLRKPTVDALMALYNEFCG